MLRCTLKVMRTNYMQEEEGGRGLISCEKCIKSEDKNLGSSFQNSHEVPQGVKVTGVIDYESTYSKAEFKQTRENELIKKWNEKQMYGQFLCDIPKTKGTEETFK